MKGVMIGSAKGLY